MERRDFQLAAGESLHSPPFDIGDLAGEQNATFAELGDRLGWFDAARATIQHAFADALRQAEGVADDGALQVCATQHRHH